jgi:hypothetical protein
MASFIKMLLLSSNYFFKNTASYEESCSDPEYGSENVSTFSKYRHYPLRPSLNHPPPHL